MWLFILSLTITAFLTLSFWIGLRRVQKHRLKVLSRLQDLSYLEQEESNDRLSKPLSERILLPIIRRIGNYVRQFAPDNYLANIEQKLDQAGRPNNISAIEWVAWQTIFLVAGVGSAIFLLATSSQPWLQRSLTVLLAFLIGVRGPAYYLKVKTEKRKQQIRRDMPDVLDLLSVSMEAGLGFDGATAKVVEKMNTTLSCELERALQEMRLGKGRREVLRRLGARSGVEELRSFIGNVIQADQLGVPMGRVMRIQSASLRQKRRQAAEERAMKAPVKMLIPLVLLIFPSLFVVLLGPAVIQIMESFL